MTKKEKLAFEMLKTARELIAEVKEVEEADAGPIVADEKSASDKVAELEAQLASFKEFAAKGKIPPQFLEHIKKKKDDGDDDKEKDDDKEASEVKVSEEVEAEDKE